MVGLKLKLLTSQKKDKKKLFIFWDSQAKTAKLCEETKLYCYFKNMYRTSSLHQNFFCFLFRLRSLVSHHPPFHQKMFYKKTSALFFVFCGEFFQIVFTEAMAHSILVTFHHFKSFDNVKKQFCCLHRFVVDLIFKLLATQNIETRKIAHFLKLYNVKTSNCVPKRCFTGTSKT